MLDASHTPLDFSQAQIRGLRKRNELTQRVLSAVNGDGGSRGGEGRAVRVAGERNREYVLVRDEGVGGWVLGLRDDGTRDRPIEVGDDGGSDDEAEGRRQGEEEGEGGDEDSEMEMEEVKMYVVILCFWCHILSPKLSLIIIIWYGTDPPPRFQTQTSAPTSASSRYPPSTNECRHRNRHRKPDPFSDTTNTHRNRNHYSISTETTPTESAYQYPSQFSEMILPHRTPTTKTMAKIRS